MQRQSRACNPKQQRGNRPHSQHRRLVPSGWAKAKQDRVKIHSALLQNLNKLRHITMFLDGYLLLPSRNSQSRNELSLLLPHFLSPKFQQNCVLTCRLSMLNLMGIQKLFTSAGFGSHSHIAKRAQPSQHTGPGTSTNTAGPPHFAPFAIQNVIFPFFFFQKAVKHLEF